MGSTGSRGRTGESGDPVSVLIWFQLLQKIGIDSNLNAYFVFCREHLEFLAGEVGWV